MLPKHQRLKKSDFSHFFSLGKRFHTPHFQLVFHPYPTFHASVVVPKKVRKSAVGRNKVRRQIYNVLYALHKTTAQPGVYIILVKKVTDAATYQRDLLEVIDKLPAIKVQ